MNYAHTHINIHIHTHAGKKIHMQTYAVAFKGLFTHINTEPVVAEYELKPLPGNMCPCV